MSLREILQHRRAIRLYDEAQPISADRVRECIELAQLAPTSSNLQLWEAYHIVQPELLQQVAHVCLDQRTAISAAQIVVFVTRQDLHRSRAKAVYDYEIENVRRHLPEKLHQMRWTALREYYLRLIPLFYRRFYGLMTPLRCTISLLRGLRKPTMTMVSEADSRIVVHKSCALAVQTFMLAMSEAGYDTCPLEGYDARRLKKLLKLPCSAEINMVVTCGIRKPQGVNGERFRVPLEAQYHRL